MLNQTMKIRAAKIALAVSFLFSHLYTNRGAVVPRDSKGGGRELEAEENGGGFAISSSRLLFDTPGEEGPSVRSGAGQRRALPDLPDANHPPFLVRAWAPAAAFPGFSFPEAAAMAGRRPTAVCFSGGGYRSFIASVSYLRALEALGLMPRVRHLTGVSGGSWAVAAYTYYARGQEGVAADDAQLLGELIEPEDLTLQRVDAPIDPRELLHATTLSLTRQVCALVGGGG